MMECYLADESWVIPNSLKDLPEDQCIFIRGFRVTRKLMILPRTLKGAAGPNPDPEGSDSEPDLELIPLSTVPDVRRSFGVF
jgi:hypothetical protein